MIANPSAFDPFRHPEASQSRRALALRRLVSYGTITDEHAEQMTETPLPAELRSVLPHAQADFVDEAHQQPPSHGRLGQQRQAGEAEASGGAAGGGRGGRHVVL